jgi:uncharacterized protein DUF4390
MKTNVVLVAACLAAGLESARAASPALADLKVERKGETYVASLRLADGLTPAIHEEIAAGLETSILYRLHVCRRRSGLPDELLHKRQVECTVRYDALTRQYTLTRRIDGELLETRATGDADVMRDFLTTVHQVPLLKSGELVSGQEYYLKAKGDIGLVWRFYLIPWPLNTDWSRVSIEVPNGRPLATQP